MTKLHNYLQKKDVGAPCACWVTLGLFSYIASYVCSFPIYSTDRGDMKFVVFTYSNGLQQGLFSMQMK